MNLATETEVGDGPSAFAHLYSPQVLSALVRALDEAGADRTLARNAFMLCHVVPIVNAALAAYQRDVCGDAAGDAGLG